MTYVVLNTKAYSSQIDQQIIMGRYWTFLPL